jgi:hypothetical protein
MSKMISLTDDGMFMASENITPAEFINMVLAAQLNLFNHIMSQAPEEDQTKLKGELYDLYNRGASAFLEAFAPEIELRPDLTAEAILKAENEILDTEVPEISKPLQDNIINLADRIHKEMQLDGLVPTIPKK